MTDRILETGRRLIMTCGYHGFSFADIAEAVGLRKASVHHHFPTKGELVVTVVEQSRALIRAQAIDLSTETDALTQLRGYTGVWERCIADGSAPFCLAAVLAAELPNLPPDVARAVRGHFEDLAAWLTAMIRLGVQQGTMQIPTSPEEEADALMASVHGAMLAARAFENPEKYSAIVGALLRRLTELRA